MRRISGLGEGRLGCVIWAAVFIVAGLIAYKAIPVKLASAQLYDYMDDQARFGARTSSEALRRAIVKKAKDLDLPVEARNVTVAKSGGIVRMRARYTVPLKVLGYTYDWDFDLEIERQVFIF